MIIRVIRVIRAIGVIRDIRVIRVIRVIRHFHCLGHLSANKSSYTHKTQRNKQTNSESTVVLSTIVLQYVRVVVSMTLNRRIGRH